MTTSSGSPGPWSPLPGPGHASQPVPRPRNVPQAKVPGNAEPTVVWSERTDVNAFVLNRRGRMVFPSNIIPELDLSTVETLDQLDDVIRRDFETKAPSGTEIREKVHTGGYDS